MINKVQKSINGILLLDKPFNMTSNGALQKVKRLFQAKKAGHTGSLDPTATGMLPICFGEATKFSQFLLDSDKSYRVTAKLGIQTSTGDAEGEVIATQPVVDVTFHRIQQVMQQLTGELDQVPPMYSAIKYQGKPLYELARRGISVERKSRRIKIYSMELESFEEDQFTFSVHCSKGTYIRTLVEDIGQALNCASHVVALRRLMVKPYEQSIMYTLDSLYLMAENMGMQHLLACLLPMETAVQILPIVKLTASAAFYLRTGQAVRANLPANTSLVRLVGLDLVFLGIGEVMTDGRIKPLRLLAQ